MDPRVRSALVLALVTGPVTWLGCSSSSPEAPAPGTPAAVAKAGGGTDAKKKADEDKKKEEEEAKRAEDEKKKEDARKMEAALKEEEEKKRQAALAAEAQKLKDADSIREATRKAEEEKMRAHEREMKELSLKEEQVKQERERMHRQELIDDRIHRIVGMKEEVRQAELEKELNDKEMQKIPVIKVRKTDCENRIKGMTAEKARLESLNGGGSSLGGGTSVRTDHSSEIGALMTKIESAKSELVRWTEQFDKLDSATKQKDQQLKDKIARGNYDVEGHIKWLKEMGYEGDLKNIGGSTVVTGTGGAVSTAAPSNGAITKVVVLKDGTKINAQKVQDFGELYGVKDAKGKTLSINKADVEEIKDFKEQ